MRSIFIFLLCCLVWGLQAQVSELNKGNGILLNFSLSGQLPGGDLADRFGPNMTLGSGVEFWTAERNFIFGLEGYYLFGTEVKEDVLVNLKDSNGFIIGNDKALADIQLRQRGLYLGALVGKLFTVSDKNPRSGIRVTVGAGLLQHKIRIQDDPFRVVPQLLDDYKKGYDRLSNGLALNQFIGYQHLSSDRRANFYIGVELTQGFTQNRRNFNFDTRSQDTETRLDLLFGLRAAWILPFYFGKGANEIYY